MIGLFVTAVKRKHGTLRSTLAGGVLFLLPLILIVWLLSKALKVIERLSDPLVNATGLHSIGGVAVGTLVSIAILVLVSYLAGLIARTRLGQATFSSFENSILTVLPQWRMARGLIESFDDENTSQMEVVLVPADAGWCIAFVLEKPDHDWWTVFIPGAPHWTSGSVSYAHSDQVHRTKLTFVQAVMLLRRCGTGSAPIHALLASLKEETAPVAPHTFQFLGAESQKPELKKSRNPKPVR
jgi:uncharacterized membrane protein